MFIERISGVFLTSLANGVIVDVNGVGYGLEMPLSAICLMPKPGETVSVWVHTHVKEDAIRLFGFKSFEDKQAFQILLSLNGVGPKVALAILSTLTVSALERAVIEEECKIIETVPGVGARLAEKIIVELKPKLTKLKAAHLVDVHQQSRYAASDFGQGLEFDKPSVEDETEIIYEDLSSALENLGYKEKTISPIIEKLRKEVGSTLDLQELMRLALKYLSGGLVEGAKSPNEKKNRSLKIDESNFF